MSPEHLKQRRVRAGQRAEGETVTCGHRDREWGPQRPRGRVLLSTSTLGQAPPCHSPRALCNLCFSEGIWLCPKFPNADPDCDPPPRGKKMMALHGPVARAFVPRMEAAGPWLCD